MSQVTETLDAGTSAGREALPPFREHIRRQVRQALVRTSDPSLFWIDVQVGSEGVALSGVVLTAGQHDTALDVAARHGRGLRIVDRLTVWSHVSSQWND